MTLINLISSYIYLKEATIREKAQTYALAFVFLILLYNSPSGLVFYWILNNLFSLFKNIIQKKCASPQRVLHLIISTLLLLAALYLLIIKTNFSLVKRVFILLVSILVCLLPLIAKKVKVFSRLLPLSCKKTVKNEEESSERTALFILSSLLIVLFCGAFLPIRVLGSSPEEFSFIDSIANPLTYVAYSLCVFFGLFFLWPLVIYKMFSDKTKTILTYLFLFLSLTFIINALLFPIKNATMNIYFWFDNDSDVILTYTKFYAIMPFILYILLVIILSLSTKLKVIKKILHFTLASLCLAVFTFSVIKIGGVQKVFNKIKTDPSY